MTIWTRDTLDLVARARTRMSVESWLEDEPGFMAEECYYCHGTGIYHSSWCSAAVEASHAIARECFPYVAHDEIDAVDLIHAVDTWTGQVAITWRWWPSVSLAELVGGCADGVVVPVTADPWYMPVPQPLDVRALTGRPDDMRALTLQKERYDRSGWDTERRRWLYAVHS